MGIAYLKFDSSIVIYTTDAAGQRIIWSRAVVPNLILLEPFLTFPFSQMFLTSR